MPVKKIADDAASREPSTPPERQRDPLARAFQLLTLMIDEGENSYGVRQIGTLLGVTPSTAHRLLADLEKLGLVRRLHGGGYSLGLEFHRLAWASIARFPLRDAAEPVLRDLSASSSESAFLGIYNEQRCQMTFASHVESSHPLRYVLELNTWLALYAGASGQAILAFLPVEVIATVIADGLSRITENTVVNKGELNAHLAEIRDKGYAISHGERIVGAVGIAAPIFGASGEVVGDVGITLPQSRFEAKKQTHLAALVKKSASELSESIGGGAQATSVNPGAGTPGRFRRGGRTVATPA